METDGCHHAHKNKKGKDTSTIAKAYVNCGRFQRDGRRSRQLNSAAPAKSQVEMGVVRVRAPLFRTIARHRSNRGEKGSHDSRSGTAFSADRIPHHSRCRVPPVSFRGPDTVTRPTPYGMIEQEFPLTSSPIMQTPLYQMTNTNEYSRACTSCPTAVSRRQ